MKQRIRYIKRDGKIVSKNEIISKHGSKYLVYIDKETMTYTIKNVLSFRKYEGGENINNMNVLKRTIKEHLAYLGVEFEKERRNRTFGICPPKWSQTKEIEKRKALKNSYRLINFSNVSIGGQDEETFTRNQLSVFVERERFKIPRIVKNYLLRHAR